MDVTFRELEPYYSTQVASSFGDSLDTGGMRREGEDDSSSERRMVSVGIFPVHLWSRPRCLIMGGPNQRMVGLRLRGS
jgi:hypothetical protein